MNVHDQEKIINILHNNALITVIDEQNLLATIDHFNLMTSDGKEYNISIPSKGNLFSLLKIYYEKLGKSVNESDFTFLKDIVLKISLKNYLVLINNINIKLFINSKKKYYNIYL